MCILATSSQEVKKECYKWSITKESQFHTDKALSDFNPALIWREMCEKAPLLMEVLKAATDIRRDRHSNHFKEDQRNHLIMCAAIILKLRSKQSFTFMQSLISSALYDASIKVSIIVMVDYY